MSRLSNALLAALALHGALFLMRSRHAPQPAPFAAPPATELDEVELAPTPTQPDDEAAKPSALPGAANALSSHSAIRASTHAAENAAALAANASATQGADAEASDGTASAPATTGSAAAAANAPAPINLHLDDGFFMRPASEDLPRQRKPEFQRQMEASVLADDVKRGAARSNVLLGSLNDAVRGSGPVRGEALLSVVVGADGSVSTVQVLRGAASEWASAIESFRALAARKHVRVPAGARGLRVTFSIQSKVQLPSGKALGSGGNVQPSGLGLSGTFDVADIGAVAQRMVHAHVVSEELL